MGEFLVKTWNIKGIFDNGFVFKNYNCFSPFLDIFFTFLKSIFILESKYKKWKQVSECIDKYELWQSWEKSQNIVNWNKKRNW